LSSGLHRDLKNFSSLVQKNKNLATVLPDSQVKKIRLIFPTALKDI
jgi:hypothetical protein